MLSLITYHLYLVISKSEPFKTFETLKVLQFSLLKQVFSVKHMEYTIANREREFSFLAMTVWSIIGVGFHKPVLWFSGAEFRL